MVEQLYTGSQRALAVVALSNEVPTHLADVLRRLAVLPQRFQELRRASARAGAIAALSRAKAVGASVSARPRGCNTRALGASSARTECARRNAMALQSAWLELGFSRVGL